VEGQTVASRLSEVREEAESNSRAVAAVKPTLLVVSDSAPLSHRIESACADYGLKIVESLSSPQEVDEQIADDSSAIVAFVCNVDSASEMASLRRLRRELRKIAIVVISSPATGTGVRRALDAGADAVVFEPDIAMTLAITVLAVASGQSAVPRKLRASVERPAFSHRERQVLALVSKGLTNSEIAERMLLAQSTVKSHLSSAFAKLGIRSRKEVVTLLHDPEQAQSVGLASLNGNGAGADGSWAEHGVLPQTIA
jgi:DNA-binding NarL/FixJ family response regulator